MARATSIKDELEILKKGTILYKVSSILFCKKEIILPASIFPQIRNKGVRGVKCFKRKYRLDLADLRITYHPNKAMAKGQNCAGGQGGEKFIFVLFHSQKTLCDFSRSSVLL